MIPKTSPDISAQIPAVVALRNTTVTNVSQAKSDNLRKIAQSALESDFHFMGCKRFMFWQGYLEFSEMTVKTVIETDYFYLPKSEKEGNKYDILCAPALRNCTATIVKIPTGSNGSIYSLFHISPVTSQKVHMGRDFSDNSPPGFPKVCFDDKTKLHVATIHPTHIRQLFTKRNPEDYASYKDFKPFSVVDEASRFDVFFDTITEEVMAIQKNGCARFLGKIF